MYTLSKWTLRNFLNNYWENTWLKTYEPWLYQWWGDHSAVYSSQQLELPSGLKTCLGARPWVRSGWWCPVVRQVGASPSIVHITVTTWDFHGIFPPGEIFKELWRMMHHPTGMIRIRSICIAGIEIPWEGGNSSPWCLPCQPCIDTWDIIARCTHAYIYYI